ncbi:protein-glutamate O-methyltransferase CheR [Cellulosimicrobium cellulans]|uniref:CheR family methyltransferase n=1 Tax=Cellulosimicrobium cellulans TaxID=1710 RepID=UPI001883ED34|nr:protein-glutamate O-methyltransferase CheR [Cellulosimicrobium cellulans]MBE9927269.1 protein-glutamate O-methyltransferase CheR [Cellulosimicrobium cellulans]
MTVSTQSFAYVSDLVRKHSAIQLAPGKEYLVEARLGPLAREKGLQGPDAVDSYVRRYLRGGSPTETVRVVEAMTTNETSWFRDSSPFTALRRAILPELAGADLSIWSAACSTGQEPYSIAMVLREERVRSYRILATDINAQVVERARTGRYSQLEINRGLPAPMLVRNFRRVGAEWEVDPALRENLTFQQHNLLTAPPGPRMFDIVFLRNVLIYFDMPTKQSILARLRSRVRPGGFLLLGAAETTVGVDPAWERVDVTQGSIYRLRGGSA